MKKISESEDFDGVIDYVERKTWACEIESKYCKCFSVLAIRRNVHGVCELA